LDTSSFDWSSVAAAIVAAMSPLEIAGVAFGVLYLILAVRQNILCWAAALIGVSLALIVLYDARLYPEAALQPFYAAMAIYGWREWRQGRLPGHFESGLAVSVWSARRHLLAIGSILVASAVAGRVLSETDAAFPYLGSFTSIASVVTTFMVARKILENWVYWFVIDSIEVYLYTSRGLYLYAALFVFYLVLVVIGFVRWLRDWRGRGEHAVA
jgi:nicotinamide mononucleotide transporter